MILVDTSVWIEVFASPPGLDLASVASLDEVVTCLPVVQEVLQGFREEGACRVARQAMLAFPMVDSPVPAEAFIQAAELYRGARRMGLAIRSGVDCLIAASALRHGLAVAHHDRDFDALARIAPLQVKRVPAGGLSRRRRPTGRR